MNAQHALVKLLNVMLEDPEITHIEGRDVEYLHLEICLF